MSRFVSAGTAEDPPERDDEWLRAQQELDDAARRKRDEGSGVQDGGKSLYEVLQANKAAKQEQFEESIRLKNQFRSLDEDEIDFLDSVLESTRAKDEAVRKETTEQLDAFRRQQEEAERAAREDEEGAVEEAQEQWHVGGRKRKKGKERENLKGFKLRKMSSSTDAPASEDVKSPKDVNDKSPSSQEDKSQITDKSKVSGSEPIIKSTAESPGLSTKNGKESVPQDKSTSPPKAASPAGLGLDVYSSDED